MKAMKRKAHVFLSSAFTPNFYRCFLIFVYLNCITVSRPYPADEDDVFKQTYIGLGTEFIENEVSTLFALDTLDTGIVTCRIKRKFLRRKLLYFSNGTESFNPVKIQIILCGDVHPNPGPNSRQNQNH